MKHLRHFLFLFVAFLSFHSPKVNAQDSPTYSPTPRPLPTRWHMPVANVNAVIQDSEGYMWYATYEGGLCRDNGYQIDVFRRDKEHPTLLTDNIIYSLCEAPNGEIWFSTAQSVCFLDKHDYSIRPLNDNFRHISAQQISRLPNGNLLVEGDTMAYEVTPGHQIVSTRKAKYQGRKRITQQDEDGGTWLCRMEKDICYVGKDTTQVLHRYDIKAKNILLDTRHHRLFAITQSGLQVFEAYRGMLGRMMYEYRDIPEIGVYGLYLDRHDNLWMTGYQPSFTIFAQPADRNSKKLNIKSPQFDEVYIDRLMPLSDKRLGVFKDIYYWSAYHLATDSEELLASDTLSPKSRWKDDAQLLQLADQRFGLDTLLVKDAAIDRQNHLWVVFDQHVRELSTTTGQYRDITVANYAPGMNNFSCVAAVDGGVCIGGAGGAYFFASNGQLDKATHQVTASVSSYVAATDDGQSVRGFLYADGHTPALTLSPHNTSLTLFLTSYNHLNAPQIRFAIKVAGWNNDWVQLNAGENTFRIVNLPKGDYRVSLRATDADGIWGDGQEVLLIHRLPAWWESWWAHAAYALLAAGIVIGAFLLYRYVHRKREQFSQMLRLYETMPATRLSANGSEPRATTVEPGHGSPQNREFSNKAIAIVRANIDNENYTVDMMAEAMCMSRVNLYRKMMAVCGQTPSDFIKTLRMEQAYNLLTTTDLPVNIVAGKCGFTSSSYFAKCFKTRYGMLPTSLREGAAT